MASLGLAEAADIATVIGVGGVVIALVALCVAWKDKRIQRTYIYSAQMSELQFIQATRVLRSCLKEAGTDARAGWASWKALPPEAQAVSIAVWNLFEVAAGKYNHRPFGVLPLGLLDRRRARQEFGETAVRLFHETEWILKEATHSDEGSDDRQRASTFSEWRKMVKDMEKRDPSLARKPSDPDSANTHGTE